MVICHLCGLYYRCRTGFGCNTSLVGEYNVVAIIICCKILVLTVIYRISRAVAVSVYASLLGIMAVPTVAANIKSRHIPESHKQIALSVIVVRRCQFKINPLVWHQFNLAAVIDFGHTLWINKVCEDGVVGLCKENFISAVRVIYKAWHQRHCHNQTCVEL